MMKYKAECTYCISQICNLYPNREEHPFTNHSGKTYIQVDTTYERDYIELFNKAMRLAIEDYQKLEKYISNK